MEIQAQVILQGDEDAGAHLAHRVQKRGVVHVGGGIGDGVVVVEHKALIAQSLLSSLGSMLSEGNGFSIT